MGKRGEGHVRTFYKVAYRLIYDNGKQRLEHRVVMEQHLGRRLRVDEVVHHKDGDGLNNRIDNLEVLSTLEHRRRHGGPRNWSLEEGLALWDQGFSVEAIAMKLGMSYTTIYRAFSRRGLPTARADKYTWDITEGIRMYTEGKTQSEIARHFNISRPSVRKALIKHGVLA